MWLSHCSTLPGLWRGSYPANQVTRAGVRASLVVEQASTVQIGQPLTERRRTTAEPIAHLPNRVPPGGLPTALPCLVGKVQTVDNNSVSILVAIHHKIDGEIRCIHYFFLCFGARPMDPAGLRTAVFRFGRGLGMGLRRGTPPGGRPTWVNR